MGIGVSPAEIGMIVFVFFIPAYILLAPLTGTMSTEVVSITESGTVQEPKKCSDLIEVGGNILSNINFKVGLFLFFIAILIFSDLFVQAVIAPLGGTDVNGATTTQGTVTQLAILTVAYLLVDVLDKYSII